MKHYRVTSECELCKKSTIKVAKVTVDASVSHDEFDEQDFERTLVGSTIEGWIVLSAKVTKKKEIFPVIK
jgi:hypothetical protein